ncbi:MAG: peptidylprolyl isomerase [Chthoniobacterales bacterium]
MKGGLAVLTVVVICIAGIAAGQWILHLPVGRDTIGRLFGRGRLLALVHGQGIYQVDVDRMIAEKAEAAGEPQDRHVGQSGAQILRWLIATSVARALGRQEKIGPDEVDREVDLLRRQFGDAKEWSKALGKSGFAERSLRRTISDDLRAGRWVRQQIGPELQIMPDECRAFYAMHPEAFVQPERFRASHLFLAAPPETPREIVEQKSAKIEALSKRLAGGEDFFELVALESEDEATKARGGDLGFFTESRMPADFFAAVRKLQVGQISPPVRTQLGFHIVEVTDFKPARQMGTDEVQPEIACSLENQKRRIAVSYLPARLLEQVEFVRF